jgi:hypothetical protein
MIEHLRPKSGDYWENHHFRAVLELCNYDSPAWVSQEKKDSVFLAIWEYYKNRHPGDGSCTAILLFEIYLMNNGFEIKSYCPMNTYKPGLTIICGKQDIDSISDIKGIFYGRWYLKGEIGISLSLVNQNLGFCFTILPSNKTFQISNDYRDYHDAISGKLKQVL